LPFTIEGLEVTVETSFLIICSASIRDLSSRLTNYEKRAT
jgi:hypothetical protein